MRASPLPQLAALALAACALATACGGGGSSRAEPVKIRGNSLVLIDEASAKVVADVPVGRNPARIAYGQGAFWVLSPDARTVVRVDADTKTATRFHLGAEPYDVAIGAGALWVPDHDLQRLLRFDLVTHALRQAGNLGVPAISVGFGFGSVWLVVADGRLLRRLREVAGFPERHAYRRSVRLRRVEAPGHRSRNEAVWGSGRA